MKKDLIKNAFTATIAVAIALAFTGCRDSSIDDEYDAGILAANSTEVSVSLPSKPEDETYSRQLSIQDSSTASSKLSELEVTGDLSGSVNIDGSALMSAISDKIAEQFRKAFPNMSIKTSLSGTDEGIARFIDKRVDICNTSRPFSKSEANKAVSAGISYTEFQVAYDGVVIVVNKDNPVDIISYAEINEIWKPDSSITNWNEVNSKWPENDLVVFGPKAGTGIIEFFTKNVLNTIDNQMGAYTEVNSDKELVASIAGDNSAIGLTGFATYFNSRESIKALKVDFGSGPVEPDIASIKEGKYQKLSSPMYLYVANASLERKEVKAFIKYYMENASKIVTQSGYIPLSDKVYSEQMKLLN